MAAGPQRDRLSQPEAATAARRRHRGAGPHCRSTAMKADIEGGAVEGRMALSRRHGGSRLEGRCRTESGASRSRCGRRVCAVAGGPARRMAGRGEAIAGHRPRHSAGQELRPLRVRLAYSPAKLSLDQLKIGRFESVIAGGRGQFRPHHRDRKVRAQFERRLAGPADQPDCAGFACAGRPAQCDRDRPGAGATETGARPRQECRAVRSCPGARHSSILKRRC